jgi:hypothetical protein
MHPVFRIELTFVKNPPSPLIQALRIGTRAKAVRWFSETQEV